MIIFLPILGNPDGRILEHFPDTEPAQARISQMLNRYGAFCPASGIAEVVTEQGTEHAITFSLQSPGVWNFRTAPATQETLF